MPIRHRPDFKEALSTFRRLKNKKIKLITKIGGKALPRLGGNGKILGGIPHLRHHSDDGPSTDGAVEPAKISERSIYLWNESQTNLVQKLQRQNSVTTNAVYCHRRSV